MMSRRLIDIDMMIHRHERKQSRNPGLSANTAWWLVDRWARTINRFTWPICKTKHDAAKCTNTPITYILNDLMCSTKKAANNNNNNTLQNNIIIDTIRCLLWFSSVAELHRRHTFIRQSKGHFTGFASSGICLMFDGTQFASVDFHWFRSRHVLPNLEIRKYPHTFVVDVSFACITCQNASNARWPNSLSNETLCAL